MPLARQFTISINSELLHKAIDAAMSKEVYRKAHREARGFGRETLQIIYDLLFRLDGEPMVGHMTAESVIALEMAWEEAREKYRAYRIAKARKRECYKAYRKAKTAVRNLLRCNWFERIRFASRAIGNVWDDSLKMVATPPTMVSVDEYFDACVLNIHQRGGALVGSLA